MTDSIHPQTLDARQAGLVRRYSTWPHSREQSVGEHSWQLARILLTIYPEVRREVLIYTLMHDLGERVAGDIPYPVKANNPPLKKMMDGIEESASLAIHGAWGMRWQSPDELTRIELDLVKLAELIEMAEWALNEMNTGNRYAALVFERCTEGWQKKLSDIVDDLPEGVKAGVLAYTAKRQKFEFDILGDELWRPR